jgi:hypothetical protein
MLTGFPWKSGHGNSYRSVERSMKPACELAIQSVVAKNFLMFLVSLLGTLCASLTPTSPLPW